MCRPAFPLAVLAALIATAARADAIDPCSLLSPEEAVELGVARPEPSHEAQPGGVEACKFLPASGAGADGTASVILSQGVPERALQLRAMQARAHDSTHAEQQARGEYFEEDVMCKVVVSAGKETSQCIGATDQSVVALTVSRPSLANEASFPASQLRTMARLVFRVAARGG